MLIKITITILCSLVFNMCAYSQQKDVLQQKNIFLDLSATVGPSQGTISVSYIHNWRMGKKKKFEAGLGLRNTAYFGTKKDFITAGPAKLTRTYTTPFLIFFAGQRPENFDTLTVQRPFTNSLNATVNIGYHFNSSLYAGFNIDLIGVTTGSKTSAIFKSNGETITEPEAKPSVFNLLLTGDHDKGSLNSEFFLQYKITDRWAVKALYQFIFIEYKRTTAMQIIENGRIITRFRNKANNIGLGVSYNLGKK